MDSIERTVRAHLSEETQGSAGGLSATQSFCETIEKDSLNVKIHEALALRSQGHFDRAMLNIAEANRDQVTAIREIQKLLGQARDEEYAEVVFEKFRQFEPFEIGISNADAMLTILVELDGGEDPRLKEITLELHDCELRKKDEEGYLSFLEERLDDGSGSEEAVEAKENILSLTRNLMEHRVRILEKILVALVVALKKMPSGFERDRILLDLSRNIFLVVTSPILTKPATHVDSER